MLDFVRIGAALLALASIIHFGCVCNFLPQTATRKIKVTAIACVICGAMLFGCALDDDTDHEVVYYLLLLAFSFLAYELATWLDGINVCEHYIKPTEGDEK